MVRAVLACLPSSAPSVVGLVVLHVGHLLRHASYANAAGITTAEGSRLATLASEESKRAERTLISASHLARVTAESEAKARPPAWQQWAPPPATDDDEDDEADDEQPKSETKETDDDDNE